MLFADYDPHFSPHCVGRWAANVRRLVVDKLNGPEEHVAEIMKRSLSTLQCLEISRFSATSPIVQLIEQCR